MTTNQPTPAGFENLASNLFTEFFKSHADSASLIWTPVGPKVNPSNQLISTDKEIFRCSRSQFDNGFSSKQWSMIGSVCMQYFLQGKVTKL